MKTLSALLSALAATASIALASSCAQAAPALADRHVAAGMKCDACHTTAQGGPLKDEKTDYGVCASCHGDYQKVLDRTAAKHQGSGQPNPHSQHDGALPCTECHKGHQAGVNYCGQCHSFTYQVP